MVIKISDRDPSEKDNLGRQQISYGVQFVLESHHRPLEYLQSTHSKNPRLMRWSLALQPHHYTVRYISGSQNVVADYLSRC